MFIHYFQNQVFIVPIIEATFENVFTYLSGRFGDYVRYYKVGIAPFHQASILELAMFALLDGQFFLHSIEQNYLFKVKISPFQK